MAVASLQGLSRLSRDPPIVGLEFGGEAGDLDVRGVEDVAIGDDLGDVRVELRGSDVLVGPQVVLDGREVHRLLYYLRVVRDAQGDGVDRLPEQP